jgi:resuscitation-promoting factor RpfA
LGWPVATSPPAAPPLLAGEHRDLVVVVRPGDTLWSIAAAADPSASAAEIAASWPRWWRANRDVIGADPGLLRPGQHLLAPTEPPDHDIRRAR